MAKKPNITNDRVVVAAAKAEDLFLDLQDIAEEVRAGRCDDIPQIEEYARNFVGLARIAADAAGALLFKKAMVDDREALRKALEAQVTDAGREALK